MADRGSPTRHSTAHPAAWAIGVTLVLLAAGTVVAVNALRSSGVQLLSSHRPATASSSATGSEPADAVDGRAGTPWRAIGGDPQWLQVDLQARAQLQRIAVDWSGAGYSGAYQVQISDDAQTWTTAARLAGSQGSQSVALVGAGRYVRIYLTARATASGYAIGELRVYGIPLADKCGGRNVARGQPVTASSTENSELPARAAVDGNVASRWSSTWSDPQSLTVDLGHRETICQAVLAWEDAYAASYEIQVSDDARQWRTSYATTIGNGGRQTLFLAGTGRYVRLWLRARATRYGYSVRELEIRTGSTPALTPADEARGMAARDETLLSFHKPVEASSSRDDVGCPACAAANAVDADPATRWATRAPPGSPAYLQVDLGGPADIDRVVLQWATQFARAYDIQVSPDARRWHTVWRTSAGRGLLEKVPVRAAGRFLRVRTTLGADATGYSLWELGVYGTGGVPVAPPAPPPPPRNPPQLVWQDEFNGAPGQPPDPHKWHPDVGLGGTGELQYYTDNHNTYQDGTGNLVLEARREQTAGSTCPRDPISGSTTCQYTSARLNTHGSFSFTYGRVEARIKVSGTPGLWPAFWMLGDNLYTGQANWPSCGEVDVMEHVGVAPDEISSTLHASAYHDGSGIGARYHTAGDAAADFHVYAADWRPDRIAFSVDGKTFFTVSRATTETTRGPWVYDHPFALLLDNALGGAFPGPPTAATVLPQRMLVDYVRVFQ